MTPRTSRPMPDEPRPVILSGKRVGRPNSVVLSGKTGRTQDVASSRRDLGGEAASARGEPCTPPGRRPALTCLGPLTARSVPERF